MSYILGTSINPIKLADSAQNDAFGRLRISEPVSLIDTTFQYGSNPLFWESVVIGNASTNLLQVESAIQLSCSSTNGDNAIRQTFEYYRYQPGRSQQILMTGLLGAPKMNVEQYIGLFDASNGLFFKQDGSTFNVCLRSHTSGTTITTLYNQPNWNIDHMDGYGPSQIKINTSNAQIFVIDFEWLGIGRVRFGFNVDGKTYYCHQILNANNITSVYMASANLPLRYELKNVGTTASSTTMKQLCSTVTSEGGSREFDGIIHSVNNGITSIAVTTRRPILSITPKLLYNNLVNRSTLIYESFSIYPSSDIFYEIVYDGSLSGASFNSAGINSTINFDVASTVITGGEVIKSGYIPSTGGTQIGFSASINARLPLALNLAATKGKTLSIVITSITGTANCLGSIDIREIY